MPSCALPCGRLGWCSEAPGCTRQGHATHGAYPPEQPYVQADTTPALRPGPRSLPCPFCIPAGLSPMSYGHAGQRGGVAPPMAWKSALVHCSGHPYRLRDQRQGQTVALSGVVARGIPLLGSAHLSGVSRKRTGGGMGSWRVGTVPMSGPRSTPHKGAAGLHSTGTGLITGGATLALCTTRTNILSTRPRHGPQA